MNKILRIGDYIVYNGHNERITAIDNVHVTCGLFASVPVSKVVTPKLTEEFFKVNDFVYERRANEDTYLIGGGETFILAIKREKFFQVTINNKVFRFEGVVDDLNEFLHAVDACAITTDFVCD